MSIYGQSDRDILQEIGRRLKQWRLNQNISQQELAQRAGITRTTISLIEAGNVFSILTLIQLLRALNALPQLDLFLPHPGVSPLQAAKLQGKKRQRASRQTSNTGKPKSESSW